MGRVTDMAIVSAVTVTVPHGQGAAGRLDGPSTAASLTVLAPRTGMTMAAALATMAAPPVLPGARPWVGMTMAAGTRNRIRSLLQLLQRSRRGSQRGGRWSAIECRGSLSHDPGQGISILMGIQWSGMSLMNLIGRFLWQGVHSV